MKKNVPGETLQVGSHLLNVFIFSSNIQSYVLPQIWHFWHLSKLSNWHNIKWDSIIHNILSYYCNVQHSNNFILAKAF